MQNRNGTQSYRVVLIIDATNAWSVRNTRNYRVVSVEARDQPSAEHAATMLSMKWGAKVRVLHVYPFAPGEIGA